MPLVPLACAAVLAISSAGPEPGAIPLDEAARCFERARLLSEADGGLLWGKPLYGPMFFVDPATRLVVANEPDSEGSLRAESGVFVGTLPPDQNIANTAIEWAGRRWTMVMWPLPESTYARGRLMMHELFHRIQDDLGLPGSNPANGHLDSMDGRIWLQLELRALGEALIRTGNQRRQAIGDALVFRAMRRSCFPPQAADDEKALEFNEGMAEYTGFRLCGLPAHVLPDRVAIRIETQPASGGFSRSFAYLTGPTYGLLLDDASPDWRRGLTPAQDLSELLRGALRLPAAAEPRRAADEAADRYDGSRLIALERHRDQRRVARLEACRRSFIDGSVLSIPLTPEVRYSFNPNGIEAYDEHSSVYETTRIADEWGVLEVSSGGALLRREGGRMAEARVPVAAGAAEAPLRGEGWVLTLDDGWRVVTGPRDGDWVVQRSP